MARRKAETIVTEETTAAENEIITETVTASEELKIDNMAQETEPSPKLEPDAEPVLQDIPDTNLEATEPEASLSPDPQIEIPVTEELPVSEDLPDTADSDSTEAPQPAASRRNTQQRVITIDGKVYDGQSAQSGTAAEVRRAIQRGNTLSGNLFAVDTTSGGMPYGIILYKDMRVIIPAAELIDITKVQVNEDSAIEREVNAVLNGMLDAEIEFIPKGVDIRNGIITASRREAMEKQAKRFYKTPTIGGKPLIVENGLAEGRIIRVTPHTVTLDLFGVDVMIPGEEISWSWINDAREVYHVGETLIVRVLHIDINGSEVSVSASIKQTKKDPYIDLERKIQVRRPYVGEIQSPGPRFIRVSIGDMDCTCPYPDWMDSVIPGTKVSVRITSINPEIHRIRGSITRVIKEV